MNGTDAFNVKHQFLSAFVGFARTMETQRTITGVKAKKAVFWERLIFVRRQSDDIPVKGDDGFHVFDKKHNAAEIQFIVHFILSILAVQLSGNNIQTSQDSHGIRNHAAF